MDQPVQTAPPPMLPVSSGETTTALVHYYRAEVSRMTSWRDRLDRTSNWAITVVAALLSVSLSTPTAHHGVLLLAMLLVSLLLFVEARRYRFYDVYRARVRQFERHYFARLFQAADAEKPEAWLGALARDLRHPRFRISRQVAVRRRLRRNYIFMYLILLLAWILKIASPNVQTNGSLGSASENLWAMLGNASLGPVPGLLVVAAVLAFYVWLIREAVRERQRAEDDEVHV